MKKIISAILALTMIVSLSNLVIASEGENYKYILPMEYSRIEINANCIVACDSQGKCAIYDFDGKKISDDFDNIGTFVDNQVALATNGTTSYVINYQGRVISEFDKNVIGIDNFVFVNHSDINNDGRPYSYYEGEFGVYTYNGKLLKVLSYDKFMPTKNSGYGITFSGYRLIYEENGKFGALDSDFNVAIQPEFDKIYPFYNNDSYIAVAIKNGKYGLIDNYGSTVADFVYDYIDPLYENGKINAYKVKQGENYGLLDKFGKMIKTPDEKIPKALHENYSLIEVYVENTREDSSEYANLYGLIDFDGNIVVPIEHTNISGISEGIIEAQKSYDHRGYYDLFGNEITDFKYRIASRFSEGLAFTESYTDGVWTNEVINNKGEVVFKPSGWSNGFYGGIAYIGSGEIIDTSGKVVIHNEDWKTVSGLNWWDSTRDGIFIVSNGDLSGLVKYIEDEQEPLWDYEYIDFPNTKTFYKQENGYQFTTLDGENIYLDENGNVTEDVALVGENILVKDDKYEIIDNNNNVILTADMRECTPMESDKYISVVLGKYTEADGDKNRIFKIYAKEDGTLLFEAPYENFQRSGVGCPYVDDNGFFVFHNKDKKYGIANVTGKITTELQYDNIEPFDGVNYKALKDNKWSVIDVNNKTLLEFDYEGIPSLLNELEENNKSKYILLDNNGSQKLIDLNGNLLCELNDGRNVASILDDKALIISYINEENGSYYSLTDLSGKAIIEEDRQYIEYAGGDIFKVIKNNSTYLVNLEGKVIAANLKHATNMGDNGYIGISQDNFEGYITADGKAALTLKNGYYVQGTFSEGLAPIIKGQPVYSLYGDVRYINEQGDIMLKPTDKTWCWGGEFENGLIEVGISLGKAGASGKNLVRCVYDTPSSWAAETIDEAITLKLVPDELQKRYRKNINREDFCEIAYNLPVIQNALNNQNIKLGSFDDTNNKKILMLNSLGIIKGVGDNKFAPESFITREEAATILKRICDIGNLEIDYSSSTFDDDVMISDWAKDAVYAMRALGIMQGVSNTEFSPKGTYTVEQAITTILRLYKID